MHTVVMHLLAVSRGSDLWALLKSLSAPSPVDTNGDGSISPVAGAGVSSTVPTATITRVDVRACVRSALLLNQLHTQTAYKRWVQTNDLCTQEVLVNKGEHAVAHTYRSSATLVSWPSSLSALQAQPWGVVRVRRNMAHVLLVADPSTREVLRCSETLALVHYAVRAAYARSGLWAPVVILAYGIRIHTSSFSSVYPLAGPCLVAARSPTRPRPDTSSVHGASGGRRWQGC